MFWGFFFFFWSKFPTPEKQSLKNKSNPFYLNCQLLRRVRHLANCSCLSCWVSGWAPRRGGHISWDEEKWRSWCSSLLLPLTLCRGSIYVTVPLCAPAAHRAQQSWPFSPPAAKRKPLRRALWDLWMTSTAEAPSLIVTRASSTRRQHKNRKQRNARVVRASVRKLAGQSVIPCFWFT